MDADTRRWFIELKRRIQKLEDRLDPPQPLEFRRRLPPLDLTAPPAYHPNGTNEDPMVEVSE